MRLTEQKIFPMEVYERIEISGKRSQTAIQKCPPISIPELKNSSYNIEVTAADTFDPVYGINERRLGKEYKDWFCLELSQNPRGNTCDFFEHSNQNDKIRKDFLTPFFQQKYKDFSCFQSYNK